MRRRMLWTVAVLTAACGGEAGETQTATPPIDLDAERAAIQEAWDGVNAAFLAGDWEPYSAHFVQAPHFRMIHPEMREWLSGASEFADVYQGRIQAGAEWEISTERFEINLSPSGDVAWTNTEVVLARGDQAQTAWQLTVWEKRDDRWLVSSAMSSTLPPGQSGG